MRTPLAPVSLELVPSRLGTQSDGGSARRFLIRAWRESPVLSWTLLPFRVRRGGVESGADPSCPTIHSRVATATHQLRPDTTVRSPAAGGRGRPERHTATGPSPVLSRPVSVSSSPTIAVAGAFSYPIPCALRLRIHFGVSGWRVSLSESCVRARKIIAADFFFVKKVAGRRRSGRRHLSAMLSKADAGGGGRSLLAPLSTDVEDGGGPERDHLLRHAFCSAVLFLRRELRDTMMIHPHPHPHRPSVVFYSC